MKVIQHRDIPDFDSFVDFCYWYVHDGYFICYPEKWSFADVGNTYENIIFRHKRFQVEMYFVTAEFKIPKHKHPDINILEIIHAPNQLNSGSGNPLTKEDIQKRIKPAGTPHGGANSPLVSSQGTGGFILVVLEEWCLPADAKMTFLSNRYTGIALSEKHVTNVLEAYPDTTVMIKKHNNKEYKWIDSSLCR